MTQVTNILRCYGEIYDANVIKGSGCYVYDDQGNKYVDFEAGVWSAALGHGHPKVNAALHQQIDQIMHLGYRYHNPMVDEASQVLLETLGFASGKCIFLSSGSEAMEFGVQIVRRMTNRPLLLALSGSYLGAYGSAGKRDTAEWCLFDWRECAACTKTCDRNCQRMAAIPFDQIAGFVFEPGNSSGLVLLPPTSLIRAIERKVKEQGGLVVANEVTTGLGRTGEWFGYDHYGLRPDIVALGKHIGNGYPVSAVVIKEALGVRIERENYRYAQSHQNDALGCAVASTVIKTIKEEGLIARSREMGRVFRERLVGLKGRHKCISEVRGRGLMLAIQLVHISPEVVQRELFRRGFLVGLSQLAGVLRFYPPLTIRIEDIDNLIEALDDLLTSND